MKPQRSVFIGGVFVAFVVFGLIFSACPEPGTNPEPLSGTVSITGTAQVGQTLTANTTNLGGNGTISYQWKRISTNGGTTTNIGANSSTYTVQATDADSTITVTVTRSGYSGSVSSNPIAVVLRPTLESITGLAAQLAWLQSYAQSNTSYILEVDADESIASHTLSYGDRTGITVTLKGIGANRVVSLSSNGSLFTIASDITLILDSNITLQGHRYNSSSLVFINSGGKLEMNTGSKISDNTAHVTFSSGGVHVVGGTFIMNGGEISGNTASAALSSGGVCIGDVISGVKSGTFTMYGGIISGNTTEWGGGGVEMIGGTFTMYGGIISGNTTLEGSGSGVYMSEGTFIMQGGEISGNTASLGGAGVFVGDGTFTMNDGKIFGNTASYYGAGVHVGFEALFTMNGGEISGNTVTGSYTGGGGVNVTLGTFTMNGGKIFDNTVTGTSSSDGGGVAVDSGTFTMQGGEIFGNTVSGSNSRGGGVYIGSSSTVFRIVTGTIYGSNEADASLRNTATNGAALYHQWSFITQYGTFSGDTWNSNGTLGTTNETIKVVNGVFAGGVSLDGVWEYPNGMQITASGSSGIYTSLGSPSPFWADAISKNYIKLGGITWRNIVRTGNLTWSGQALVVYSNTSSPNVAVGTGWGNCTITMSTDGQTITWTVTVPAGTVIETLTRRYSGYNQ